MEILQIRVINRGERSGDAHTILHSILITQHKLRDTMLVNSNSNDDVHCLALIFAYRMQTFDHSRMRVLQSCYHSPLKNSHDLRRPRSALQRTHCHFHCPRSQSIKREHVYLPTLSCPTLLDKDVD